MKSQINNALRQIKEKEEEIIERALKNEGFVIIRSGTGGVLNLDEVKRKIEMREFIGGQRHLYYEGKLILKLFKPYYNKGKLSFNYVILNEGGTMKKEKYEIPSQIAIVTYESKKWGARLYGREGDDFVINPTGTFISASNAKGALNLALSMADKHRLFVLITPDCAGALRKGEENDIDDKRN